MPVQEFQPEHVLHLVTERTRNPRRSAYPAMSAFEMVEMKVESIGGCMKSHLEAHLWQAPLPTQDTQCPCTKELPNRRAQSCHAKQHPT